MKKSPMSVLGAAYVDRAQELAESVDGVDRERGEVNAMCAVAIGLLAIAEELAGLRETHAVAHGLAIDHGR